MPTILQVAPCLLNVADGAISYLLFEVTGVIDPTTASAGLTGPGEWDFEVGPTTVAQQVDSSTYWFLTQLTGTVSLDDARLVVEFGQFLGFGPNLMVTITCDDATSLPVAIPAILFDPGGP